MPGDDGVEAERDGLLEQGGELDALVAAHAGVGGAASGVLVDEVADDILFEARAEVPDIEGDADDVGRSLRVHGVLDGAASAASGAQGAGHAAEREVHPDNLVAGVDGTRGSNGGVDSATHRGYNLHGIQPRQ